MEKSLQDTIANLLKSIDGYSSAELGKAISRLQKAQTKAHKREKEEEERNRILEQEKKEQALQAAKNAHIDQVTAMELPLDWSNVFENDSRTDGIHTDSIPDGLILSLSNLGYVDIEYISAVTGADMKTVICTLKGSIYQDSESWNECFYKGWQTADEYLSGNLKIKLRSAQKANEKYNGYFEENVRAIKNVLPPAVRCDDIYVAPGSPWIPADIIDSFIEHLFGDPLRTLPYTVYDEKRLRESYKTIHDEYTGSWEIPEKSRYMNGVTSFNYGTIKLNALYILERTLNMKSVTVTVITDCPSNKSGKKRVVDREETINAVEQQQKMIKEFQRWIWSDPARKKRLYDIFDEKYACVKRRNFDGSFLTFPGMDKSVRLYPYQKNAVARIIFSPNTLLAHDVGSGKTYIMIAAGQELRRMGLSKKNMYVVPNNIVGQWRDIFLKMYPNANILCIEPKNFTPSKRERVLTDIAGNDYDGIIITYSCFESIPVSKKEAIAELEKKKNEFKSIMREKSRNTSRIRKKVENLDKAINELYIALNDMYDTVFFDDLGITRLFVDEAHNFKNVPLDTQIDKVLGLNKTGSKKCRDMMDKVHIVQKNNDGKGVVMATGTPITNSVSDAFVFQQYLQSGELGMLDLQTFDAWVGMFAERKTDFEIDVDTGTYRLATRLSKVHNLPELTSLIASFADFHKVDITAEIPQTDGYRDALICKTPEFSDYLKLISARAEDVRRGVVPRDEDNMLKITTDGRKAALDMRLVNNSLPFTYESKVARCAENVFEIYHKTEAGKSAQLIFCDSSTPHNHAFNIYDEIKWLLMAMGIPESKIAYIHDAQTDAQRNTLFTAVRNGDIRILIGSTFKLGLGVNIQDRLIALHHIDIPWRPADMIQREGRILRQGNLNSKVYIYRYITEGSFDAYSWQLLETKQRFITSLLSGTLTDRDSTDIDGTVLDYAEVKALAVGNSLIKQRVEATNNLSRCILLQKKRIEQCEEMKNELSEIPSKRRTLLRAISNCILDAKQYKTDVASQPPLSDSKAKAEYANRRKAFREYLDENLRSYILMPYEKELTVYHGFKIILPANMSEIHPYVWLKKNGSYRVELGDTEIGNLVRIDNTLSTLDELCEKLNKQLEALDDKEKELKNSLANPEDYTEIIEEYKEEVRMLDEKLGVDKK